jgi:hypothetical protein
MVDEHLALYAELIAGHRANLTSGVGLS